ncbi:methyltransferase domain-containing protein [Streptomyces nondiastaticus]|uniref:methyltransferase domain-containing protein n=1 Tax=Streptomyces nondiastaticus TaxID=3154512 RepID=UPI00342C76F8
MTKPSGSPADDRAVEHALNALWEQIYDPQTTAIIEKLPIQRDWRCLDVGCGAGSMAAWLAGRADRGTVLAVDTDTEQFAAERPANLTVRNLDIAEADFAPGSFDLILGRAVFEHLADPAAALERAVSWLAPGGWILLEDFYFLPSEHAPTAAGRALVDAYLQGWKAKGADMHWGRRLPSTLARAGLTSIGLHVTPLGPGQHAADNDLMRLRMKLQGPGLVENGLVSAEDLAAFVAGLDDPAARDVTTLEFSVWGRRPEA